MERWRKNIKVIYQIKELVLNKQKISTLIGFDEIKEIINIAMNYTKSDNIDFSCIIGNSKSMTKVIEKAKIAAKSDSTILLQEIAAQARNFCKGNTLRK